MACIITYKNNKYSQQEFEKYFKNNFNEFVNEFLSQDIEGFKEFVDNKQSLLQQESKSKEQINTELENVLKDFLVTHNISLQYFDSLKNTQGQGIAGMANILKKLILISQGKAQKDTLSEEVAHFAVEILGSNDPMVKRMLRLVTSTQEYEDVVRDYNEAYNGDIDMLKKEAVGKVLAKYIIKEFEQPTNYPKGFFATLQALWNRFMNLFRPMNADQLQKEIDNVFGITAQKILGNTMETRDFLKDYEGTSELYQLSTVPLENIGKAAERISKVLNSKVKLEEHKDSSKELIRSLNEISTNVSSYLMHYRTGKLTTNAEKLYNGIMEEMNKYTHPGSRMDALERKLSYSKQSFFVKERVKKLIADELAFSAEAFLTPEEIHRLKSAETIIGVVKFLKHVRNETVTLTKEIKRIKESGDSMSIQELGKALRDIDTQSSGYMDVLNNLKNEIEKNSDNIFGDEIITKTILKNIEQLKGNVTRSETIKIDGKILRDRDGNPLTKEVPYQGLESINNQYYRLSIQKFAGFLQEFMPNKVIQVPFGKEKGKVIDIQVALEHADADINFWHRWVNAMSESGDHILGLVDVAVKEGKHIARIRALGYMKDIQNAFERLRKAGHSDGTFVYEKDKDGRNTGYLLTDRNKKEYEEAFADMQEYMHKKFGLSDDIWTRRDEKENMSAQALGDYNKMWREWFADNSEPSMLISEMNSLIEEMRKELPEGDFNIWMEEHFIFNLEGDIVGTKYELSQPSAKRYTSKAYEALTPAQKEFLDEITRIKLELDKMLPEKHRSGLLAPQMRKNFIERMSNGQYKSYISDTFKITESDIEFGSSNVLTDMGENPINMLPIYFTSRMGYWELDGKEVAHGTPNAKFVDTVAKDMSTDIGSSLMQYAFMTTNYNTLNKVVDILEVGKDLVFRRQVGEKTETGGQKVNTIKILGMEISLGIKKPGASSNAYQRLDDYLNMVVYGNYNKKGKFTKAIELLLRYTAINNLALNIYAGIQNPVLGHAIATIEAVGKEFYSAGDLAWAEKTYDSHMPHRLLELGSSNPKNKLTLWKEFYDVLQESDVRLEDRSIDRRTLAGRFYQNSSVFFINHAGEDWMQMKTSLALARNIKLKNKEGKEINLWEAMEVKGNRLQFKEGVTKLDGTAFSQSDISKFIRQTNRLNQTMHGIYNKYDSMAIQQYVLGRAALMFRKWMVPGINRRWGKLKYNHSSDSWVEGYYRTALRFLGNALKELKGKGFRSFSDQWGDLHPTEKANLKRTMLDILMLGTTIALVKALENMGDDDDDWALNMFAYQANRFRTELGFYLSPSEFMTIVQTPAASVSQLEDLFKIVSFSNVFNWGDELQSGRFKGMTKIERDLLKITPYYKTLSGIWYPEEKLKFFKLQY